MDWGHVFRRFFLHIAVDPFVLMGAYIGVQILLRQLERWGRAKLFPLLFAAVVSAYAIWWIEPSNILAGDPAQKSYWDAASHVIGFGGGAWALYRASGWLHSKFPFLQRFLSER